MKKITKTNVKLVKSQQPLDQYFENTINFILKFHVTFSP